MAEDNRRLKIIFSIIVWFYLVGYAIAQPVEGFNRPRGIFALDSAQGTNINGVSMRDANIRSNAFISGYMLRASWETLEPAQDQYDFMIIDWNLRKVQALGQKLSLQVVIPEPSYI